MLNTVFIVEFICDFLSYLFIDLSIWFVLNYYSCRKEQLVLIPTLWLRLPKQKQLFRHVPLNGDQVHEFTLNYYFLRLVTAADR